jgi:hypothetical protein
MQERVSGKENVDNENAISAVRCDEENERGRKAEKASERVA